MITIVGVRFKKNTKTYYFDPNGLEMGVGAHVIVETARGVEYGDVTMGPMEVPDTEVTNPLKPVLRVATEEDDKTYRDNAAKAERAFDICQQKIAEHGLEMKLIDAEYTFDSNKVLFYFTADGRIDFRDLVKDLAYVFKTRIELRQVGVRDEARTLGGLGICGRPLCCSLCMGDFQPVSIKMAKEQGMSLSPTKISGTCGRLMCCLKYEQAAYEDAIKRVPGIGSLVETADGRGIVVANDLLKETIQVKYERGNETDIRTYGVEGIKVLSKKFGRNSAAAAIKAEDGETVRE